MFVGTLKFGHVLEDICPGVSQQVVMLFPGIFFKIIFGHDDTDTIPMRTLLAAGKLNLSEPLPGKGTGVLYQFLFSQL